MPTEDTQKTSTLGSKLTAEIILGGETITINKLKAGKFYEAQQIFAEIIQSTRVKDSEVETVGQEGKAKVVAVDLDQVIRILKEVPTQVAKFVAFCAEMTEVEVLAKAYPEEISIAFGVCLELNNVIENLKNFVAPMEKLGA
jgi:hypothetical protein